MKYLNKIASAFFVASLGMLTMTSCEGGDLYKVNAPDWLSEMGDEEEEETVVNITPNPSKLGNADNSTAWWSEFTDDVKAEPGKTYQVKFTNFGGGSNWNNFVLILRNEAKDYEYGVFRADNWCWNTKYTDGADSDNFCQKKMESSDRDWATWLKAMSRAKCTVLITNYGDGTAYIKATMLGSDGKTYTQEYSGIDVDKDNMYFAFTVDNSHIEFGDVDVKDSEPESMVLNGVPHKVLLGTTFENAFANVSATVTFGDGVTKSVTADELQLMTIPDMDALGTKTLVAVYNKTYLGENCTTPVIARMDFEVVDKMFKSVGATDNSGAFWSAHSESVKIGAGETYVTTFTNYTAGGSNWNNFLVVLASADGATEYAVLRADNYGWGNGYAACTPMMEGERDWASWLAAMDGAKVTTYVTNKGDGTADVKCIVLGNDGKTYTQDYIGVNTVDPENFYFHLTIEKAHLVFE